MNNVDFSIVIVNNNNDNLINCIKSIQSQNYNKEKFEIILETEQLDTNILSTLKKYNNLIIREQSNVNVADCYNDALKICKGTFINFSNPNILFEDKKILSKIKSVNSANIKNKLIITNMLYKDYDTNQYKKYILSNNNNENVNLEKNSGKINTCLESYFINKRLILNLMFDKTFNEECREKFLIDVLEIEPNYYNLGNIDLISLAAYEDNTSKNLLQYKFNWYIESLSNWINYLENKKYVPVYVEEIIMYILYSKFNCNINDRNKNILDNDNYNEFLRLTQKLLTYIENNIILQQSIDSEYKKIKHKFKISRSLKMFFYKQKNNNNINRIVTNNKIYEFNNEIKTPILNLAKEKINVYAINYKKGKLIFDCTLGIKDYLNDEEIKLKIKYGKDLIKICKTDIYNSLNVFGNTYIQKYTFQFEIDINNDNFNVLEAFLLINDKEYLLNFNFVKVQSRLNNSKRSYWNYENFTILNKKDKLIIKKRKKVQTFSLELLFLLSKLKNEKNKIRVIKLSILRLLYFITKPILGTKHIWITFDKLYKAGDNGEYIYQYGLKNNQNIYYIIKKDAPEYKRLIKQNRHHVLKYNSLKAKLYSLHAEVILKTHANIFGFLGFNGLARVFISNIFNAEVMEIQHGLTIQDIPEYQNRLVDNIKLYFISSNVEKKNIEKPIYGYKDEQIKLTGLPRYDGLKSDDKKIILITPTWRHEIASPSLKHGVARGHNNIFKNSRYFKIYNGLINNKKLISTAKKYNYRIIYLIHPTLSAQIVDFEKNDYVEIIPATSNISYEKILRQSSLMVTDYSGVQYDFAYMNKTILYFHPDELPPHYTNATIDYEKDGFGDVIKNTDILIDELCKQMKNNCINEKKYINKSNKFFEYNDFNNCKRITDEIKKYIKMKNN